ncbi:hypothetical protein KC345_g116 [Hortaea werneckii]|nr:hypothetical protein KC345_g116 [Hortaea werneckii]
MTNLTTGPSKTGHTSVGARLGRRRSSPVLTQTLGTTWTGMAWMSARHVERRQSFGLVTPTGLLNETLSTRESGNDIGLNTQARARSGLLVPANGSCFPLRPAACLMHVIPHGPNAWTTAINNNGPGAANTHRRAKSHR